MIANNIRFCSTNYARVTSNFTMYIFVNGSFLIICPFWINIYSNNTDTFITIYKFFNFIFRYFINVIFAVFFWLFIRINNRIIELQQSNDNLQSKLDTILNDLEQASGSADTLRKQMNDTTAELNSWKLLLGIKIIILFKN